MSNMLKSTAPGSSTVPGPNTAVGALSPIWAAIGCLSETIQATEDEYRNLRDRVGGFTSKDEPPTSPVTPPVHGNSPVVIAIDECSYRLCGLIQNMRDIAVSLEI